VYVSLTRVADAATLPDREAVALVDALALLDDEAVALHEGEPEGDRVSDAVADALTDADTEALVLAVAVAEGPTHSQDAKAATADAPL
jgi:hypothetical protein